MICWITDKIGTCAFEKLPRTRGNYEILDARMLVDKPGNAPAEIKKLIRSALDTLSLGMRIVICCDHGISRSNSIASGVLACFGNISFYAAIRKVLEMTGHAEMKPELLDVVEHSLQGKRRPGSNRRNILVTGATGDIGSSLVPRLQSSFHVVGVSSKNLDLRKDLALLHVLVRENKIGTIVHLASPRVIHTNLAMGESLTMLKNITDVCRINKCKLVFISSLDVYGSASKDTLRVTEKTRLQPKGIQGETKYLCEELLLVKSGADHFETCILRFPAVYGKDCRKPRFLRSFIHKAKKGDPLVTHRYSNGFPFVDLLHVEDAVECIYKSLKNKVTGEYSISGGNPLSTYSIAQMIVQKLRSASAVSSVSIRDKNCNIFADNKIALKKFRWQPVRTFEEAIHELMNA